MTEENYDFICGWFQRAASNAEKQNRVESAALWLDGLAELKRLWDANEAKQAKIDALMFEWCPDEMTPEQVAEHEKNQVQVAR